MNSTGVLAEIEKAAHKQLPSRPPPKPTQSGKPNDLCRANWLRDRQTKSVGTGLGSKVKPQRQPSPDRQVLLSVKSVQRGSSYPRGTSGTCLYPLSHTTHFRRRVVPNLLHTHTHTHTAPPLQEEPDEETESSSDDEQGGTIS